MKINEHKILTRVILKLCMPPILGQSPKVKYWALHGLMNSERQETSKIDNVEL